MKYSVALVSTLAAVVLAQPKFTNSNFDITQGKSFTLKFTGCDSGCTIILQNGDSKDTKDVTTLTGAPTSCPPQLALVFHY